MWSSFARFPPMLARGWPNEIMPCYDKAAQTLDFPLRAKELHEPTVQMQSEPLNTTHNQLEQIQPVNAWRVGPWWLFSLFGANHLFSAQKGVIGHCENTHTQSECPRYRADCKLTKSERSLGQWNPDLDPKLDITMWNHFRVAWMLSHPPPTHTHIPIQKHTDTHVLYTLGPMFLFLHLLSITQQVSKDKMT